MKNVYLICYDIGDPKRWRQVYKTMLGVGDPLQYSVFRCELSLVEQQLLKERLWPVLNLDHDRMMIVNLGPAGARGDDCVEFWGEPCVEPPQRGPIIV